MPRSIRSIVHLSFALTVVALSGCGFVPEKVSLSDPRVTPLLQAAASFDRVTYGFIPIPTNAVTLNRGSNARKP
jgi:hypothetical protein